MITTFSLILSAMLTGILKNEETRQGFSKQWQV